MQAVRLVGVFNIASARSGGLWCNSPVRISFEALDEAAPGTSLPGLVGGLAHAEVVHTVAGALAERILLELEVVELDVSMWRHACACAGRCTAALPASVIDLASCFRSRTLRCRFLFTVSDGRPASFTAVRSASDSRAAWGIERGREADGSIVVVSLWSLDTRVRADRPGVTLLSGLEIVKERRLRRRLRETGGVDR